MPSWQEEIRNGQSVWSDHRNGKIISVDYLNKTVLVTFYEKGGSETFEFNDLIGNYDERLNQWIITQLI